MKIISTLLGLMFLAFTIVQFNDPDPIVWIFIYSSMVAVCVGAFFSQFSKPLMIALAVGYAIYAAVLVPGLLEWLRSDDRSLLFDDIAKMQHLYIEESREFLGLLICLVVLIAFWLRAHSQSKR